MTSLSFQHSHAIYQKGPLKYFNKDYMDNLPKKTPNLLIFF